MPCGSRIKQLIEFMSIAEEAQISVAAEASESGSAGRCRLDAGKRLSAG